MANSQKCWEFGSTQYVRATVDNLEEYLGKKVKKIPAKALTPLSSKYRPEVDISEELGEDEGSYYHSLIGVLSWIVELGQVEICCELSMMSSYLALPTQAEWSLTRPSSLRKIGVTTFTLKLQVTHKRNFRWICPNHAVQVWT